VGRVKGTALEAQMEVGKVQSRYRGHRKSRVCVDEWSGPHASGLGVSAMDARALPSDQISLSAGAKILRGWIPTYESPNGPTHNSRTWRKVMMKFRKLIKMD
jgi:hypothetical protein